MTKPELVRPFSHRQASLGFRLPTEREKRIERDQFAAIKQERDTLSIEEILDLKRERQNLIQERNMLRAKITRFSDLSKRPNPPAKRNPKSKAPSRNQMITNSLQKQIENLTQMIAAKRSDTQQLLYSDRAVLITELQEEAKMLFMEIVRLQEEKKRTDEEYREASARLKHIKACYSDSVLSEQHKTIKQLEKEITAQVERNEKIRRKIESMRQEQNDDSYIAVNDKIQQQIQDLKEKIKNERQAIKDLDQQTMQMRAEHQRNLAEIQSQM